jgi:hypothetical protein
MATGDRVATTQELDEQSGRGRKVKQSFFHCKKLKSFFL